MKLFKKKVLYIFALFLLSAAFSSCEDLLNSCETCRYNVYVAGVIDTGQTYGEAEYCGTELATLKAAPDVTVGNTVTKFECDGK